MFITREADYAIRILRELNGHGRKTVQEICEHEQVPQQYGYKILKKLEKAALVQSFRGASGGYTLARHTKDISLLDVIQAIDRELLINECLGHDYRCPMNSGGKYCGVHSELCRIQEVLTDALKERSLADFF
jgi:Rrf2 family protein